MAIGLIKSSFVYMQIFQMIRKKHQYFIIQKNRSIAEKERTVFRSGNNSFISNYSTSFFFVGASNSQFHGKKLALRIFKQIINRFSLNFRCITFLDMCHQIVQFTEIRLQNNYSANFYFPLGAQFYKNPLQHLFYFHYSIVFFFFFINYSKKCLCDFLLQFFASKIIIPNETIFRMCSN